MRTFLRRALRFDEPDRHLSGPQFLVACLIALQAALFWAAIARDPILIVVIVPLLVYPAWLTPRGEERPLMRFGVSQIEAATIAAFLTLARHFAGP
jgi:hypothetical protein